MEVEIQKADATELIKETGNTNAGKSDTVEPVSSKSSGAMSVLAGLNNEDKMPFVIVVKFSLILSIGSILYLIATINVWCFLTLSVILPSVLMIIDVFIYKIFIDTFREYLILRVKYATFVAQNVVLVVICLYEQDLAMSHAATWIYRLNILELFVDAVYNKSVVLWIPSVMLLIPIFSSDLGSFPIFEMHTDDHFILVWEEPNQWFVVMYTMWFISVIVNQGTARLVISCHTLFPLLAPPALWFSVRTFSGMFMLWFPYLKPVEALIATPDSVEDRKAFQRIFDSFFIVIFVCCYVMSGMTRLWEDGRLY